MTATTDPCAIDLVSGDARLKGHVEIGVTHVFPTQLRLPVFAAIAGMPDSGTF